MSGKQPASFDEYCEINGITSEQYKEDIEPIWQASSASLKQKLIERMPDANAIESVANNLQAQGSDTYIHSYSFQSGAEHMREEMLKIIEELT